MLSLPLTKGLSRNGNKSAFKYHSHIFSQMQSLDIMFQTSMSNGSR